MANIIADQAFYESVDISTILSRFRSFRDLNFREMSDEQVNEAVLNTLMINGKMHFLINNNILPLNTHFFRVRRIKGNLLSEYSLSDFWEPPADCLKDWQRLSRPHEPVLYVSCAPETAIAETKVKDEEYFALIKYTAITNINVNIIGGSFDYEKNGITDKHIMEINDMFIEFFRTEFTRDVGKGTEYLYRISECIAKSYFDLPFEIQDAWMYPSVQNKTQYNLCFRPDKAHKLLQLEGALICMLKDGVIQPVAIPLFNYTNPQSLFDKYSGDIMINAFSELL